MVADRDKELSTHQKVLSVIEDFGCISYSGVQKAVYHKYGVFLYKPDVRAILFYLKRIGKIYQVGDSLCIMKGKTE